MTPRTDPSHVERSVHRAAAHHDRTPPRSDHGPAERPDVVSARLARFAVTRDARVLWPDVSASAFRAAQAEIGRVIVAALSDSVAPVALQVPPGANARAIGVAAYAGAVGALLGYWCETGRVVAEPTAARVLAIHLDDGRRRATRLRSGFESALIAFADQGVEVCVLKGMHTGHRYFPEPGTRTASDVDILVRPGEWDTARAVLRQLGFIESNLGPGGIQGMSDSVTANAPTAVPSVRIVDRTHPDQPWSVDLHRSLSCTPFAGLTATLGTLDLATAEVWHEFSRPVRVLPQPLLLAYLALHASGHFYTMKQAWLVELVLVARRDFAGRAERWQALDELVSRAGVGRFVFPALELAERLVPGTIDAGLRERLATRAPRRLRQIVGATAPALAQHLHPHPGLRDRFVWIASAREAFLALAWLLWPRDGEHPASPGAALGAALGAQWRRLRRGVHRIVLGRFRR